MKINELIQNKKLRNFLYGFYHLCILLIGRIPAHWIRNILYTINGMKIGKGSAVYGRGEFFLPSGISLGEHSLIGNKAILDGRRGIEIGNNVNLSHEVMIWTLQHDVNSPSFGLVGGEVVVKDYARLGKLFFKYYEKLFG